MKIDKVEKSGEGYNVYFKDIDMVAYVHKKEEIADLKKKGFIKTKKGKK